MGKCKWDGTPYFMFHDGRPVGFNAVFVWLSNKTSFACKEALFGVQGSLLLNAKKSCLKIVHADLCFLNGFRRDSCGSVLLVIPRLYCCFWCVLKILGVFEQ